MKSILNKGYKACLTCALGLSLMSGTALANDKELSSLLELDIDELVLVSVASKRDERITEAPGIVNVLDAEEIYNSGARTLFEALERVPGIFNVISSASPASPERALSIRGNVSSIGDTHVLILMNGRPIRDGYSGALNLQVWRNFPLSAIDHVEIIRGPGSVLYGSNAFSGVVNIVTKKAEEEGELEGKIEFAGGSYDTKKGEVAAGYRLDDDTQFYVAALAGGTQGRKTNGNNILGQPIDDRFMQSNRSGIAQIDHNGFSLNYFFGRSSDDVNLVPTFGTRLQPMETRTNFVDLGYNYDIAEGWSGVVNASYTNTQADIPFQADFATRDIFIENSITGEITDDLNVLLGASYNRLAGEEILTDLDYSTKRHSAYMQLDYRPVTWLKLTGGVQYNKAEDVDSGLSPRLGALFFFDENWGAKLLYGEAFRSPYPAELFFNNPPIVNGNEDLKSETVQTFDAQIYYQSPMFDAALTGFTSKQKDTIIITPLTGNRFINDDNDVKSYGGTFEATYRPNQDWTIHGSFTYQDNELGDQDDFYLTPNILGKLGVTYRGFDGMVVDVFHQYVEVPNEGTLGAAPTNPDPDDMNLLNATISLDVPEFFDLEELQGTDAKLSFHMTNILGEDSFGPDSSGANTFEQRFDQAFYVRASLSF